MLHALLLNSTYECISFIVERKVFKLLSKGKIEILASWDTDIRWGKGKCKMPAVVRLINNVPWIPRKVRFNRNGIFRRDHYICQYCSKILTASKLTWDHILPRSQGGDNSWKNCVTSCFECNNKKGDRTPEQARMKLIRKPFVPLISIKNEYSLLKNKHPEWKLYIPNLD